MASKNAAIENEVDAVTARGPARSAGSLWENRLLWLLVLILLGYWSYGWVLDRVDPELRRRVLQVLRDRYPQHIITLESAHLVDGQAIVLSGLKISLPSRSGPQDIVHVGRATASGKVSLIDLGAGKFRIDQVVIDECDVSAFPNEDGSWSFQSLASSGPLPDNLPPILIRSGMLRVKQSGTSDVGVVCHELRARFRINRQDPKYAERPYEWQALLRSNSFDLVSVHGTVNQAKTDWELSGVVSSCHFTSELSSRLPQVWQRALTQVNGLDGDISSTFFVRSTSGPNLEFEVNGEIQNGKLVHPRLPYPLDKLNGKIYCRNDMLQLRDATAQSGQALIKLKADVYGTDASVPIVAELDATNLPLDDRMYGVMPAKLQKVWGDLELSGVADANIRFVYDGKRWEPYVNAHLREGSIRFAKFPYPVQQLQGYFELSTKRVLCEHAEAVAGGSPITMRLAMDRADQGWLFDVDIKAQRPIMIDEQLVGSLTENGRPPSAVETFVRSLHPNGLVHVRSAHIYRQVATEKAHQDIELAFREASVSYERFRYPVFDIQGTVSVHDGRVSIESLVGQNDSATIHCRGTSQCGNGQLDHLNLSFDAYAVPLEEELHQALPMGSRQLWDAIQPSGVVNHVFIELVQQGPSSPLDVGIKIDEQAGEGISNSRSVTVMPKEVPYPLTDVCCKIDYRNGIARIEQLSGHHDVSFVTAQGRFFVREDGFWSGVVDWLPSSRVLVDQSFLSCLPGYLQQPILSTAFRGPVGIVGTTTFSSNANGAGITIRDWNLDLAVEEGRLGWGQLASGIRGSVHVQGVYSGQDVLAKGNLQLDSLSIYNVPILDVQGPFAIQSGLILFGRDSDQIELPNTIEKSTTPFSPASYSVQLPRDQANSTYQASLQQSNVASLVSNANQEVSLRDANFLQAAEDPRLALHPSDLVARCFGGRLHVRGQHIVATGKSSIAIQLQEGDLRETLMDFGQQVSGISGKLWGECLFQGNLMNQQTWAGRGQAWLRRADLVQLPVMSRLFRALSVKNPESGAFESGELRFRVDGDRVPIDALSLDGDIISLRGNGWVNLRHELHLDMFAYVGKRSMIAAVLGPIVSQNDNASLMAIEVDGTLQAMEFRRSLGLMNASADQFFPERLFSPVSPEAK